MKALIVAAGLGSRLGPLSDDAPKPLVEVGGVPLIKRSIDILESRGVDDVTVVVGHKQDSIRQLLGGAVSYVTNQDYATTNNIVSMSVGAPAVEGHSFLYLHADIWYRPEIVDIVLEHPGEICFAVEQKPCGDEEMKVRVENNLVVEADKGIAPADAFGEWLGIVKFEPAGAAAFLAQVHQTIERSRTLYECAVVKDLAADGVMVHYADIGRVPWVEIDFPEDLEYARGLARAEAEG